MTPDDFENRLLAVDWERYEEPGFGSIAQTILGLHRAKPNNLELWCDQLENQLLPQAALGKGSPIAIPFLRELLERRVASECIYQTLSYITICTEDDHLTDDLCRQCRHEVRTGLDLYLRDAADSSLSAEHRRAAIDLVCRLTEDRPKWESTLRSLCNTEPSAALRTTILDCLDPSP